MNDYSRMPIPFGLGSELSSESFKLTQYDMTYLLAASRYKTFYRSYVKPRIMMYRGWIEGFHNTEYGIIPSLFLQRVGNGIKNTLFAKPPILNTDNKDTKDIITKKFKYSNFNASIKEAYGFAIEGIGGLIKWNKDGNDQLIADTVPSDKFFIETDSYGRLVKVRTFISTYHDTINSETEYSLCEERFFKYATINGETERVAMVHYVIYKTSPNVQYETTPNPEFSLKWNEVPYEVQQLFKQDYGDLMIDYYENDNIKGKGPNGNISDYANCKLLPFKNDLGCRIIKFTDNIPGFPKLPFGQPLSDILMNESYAYDQLKSFEKFEVYASRARILIDKDTSNVNDPAGRKRALDPLVYEYFEKIAGDMSSKQPEIMQPELRADAIEKQKRNILNDTAFALGLSSSTIAAWLSDGAAQRTATEIENEKTKTGTFINSKLEIIQQPLQEMIDLFFHYHGVETPELHLMPEVQTIRTESIRLYSELYDKGQITAEMLSKEILGTATNEEVNKLTSFIEQQSQALKQQAMLVPLGVANG